MSGEVARIKLAIESLKPPETLIDQETGLMLAAWINGQLVSIFHLNEIIERQREDTYG